MALTPHATYEDYVEDHLGRGNSEANMVSESAWGGGDSSGSSQAPAGEGSSGSSGSSASPTSNSASASDLVSGGFDSDGYEVPADDVKRYMRDHPSQDKYYFVEDPNNPGMFARVRKTNVSAAGLSQASGNVISFTSEGAAVSEYAGAATARPSWYDEEEHGEWKNDYGTVMAVFRDVFGRDPTSMSELQAAARFDDEESLAQHMSLTAEARSLGIDPTAYGNEAVDPETLPDEDREWYAAWAEHNDRPFYSGDLESLGWYRNVGNISLYRGIQDGTIRDAGGAYVITQAALDRYNSENGNQIRIFGTTAGNMVVAPRDADIDWHNVDRTSLGESATASLDRLYGDTEYVAYGTTGNVHRGVAGALDSLMADAGIGEDWRNTFIALGSGGVAAGAFLDETLGIKEGYFVLDPGGHTSGILWGEEGYRKNLEGGANLLGLEGRSALGKVSRGQAFGRAVASAVVSKWNPFVGFLLDSAASVSQASGGARSWGDVKKDVLRSAATMGLRSYLRGYELFDSGTFAADVANESVQAATAAAATGLVEAAATGDFQWRDYGGDVVGAAASGAVSGAAGHFAPVSNLLNGGFSYGGLATSFGTSYLGSLAGGATNMVLGLGPYSGGSGLTGSNLFENSFYSAAISSVGWAAGAWRRDSLIETIPQDLWASADAEKRDYLLRAASGMEQAKKDGRKPPEWSDVDAGYADYRADLAARPGFVDRYSDSGSVVGALANAAIAKFSPFDYEARSVATSPGKYYDSEGDRIAFGVNPGFLTRIGRSIAKAYPDWMFHGKLPNFGEAAQYTGRTAYDSSGASVLEIDPSIQVGAGAAQAHSTNVSDLQFAYRLGGISSGLAMRLGPGAVQSSSGAALRLRATRILGGSSIR